MLFVNSAKCFSQVSLRYKRIYYRKQLTYIITNITVFKQSQLIQNLKEIWCISSILNEFLLMGNSMVCLVRPPLSIGPQKKGKKLKIKRKDQRKSFLKKNLRFFHSFSKIFLCPAWGVVRLEMEEKFFLPCILFRLIQNFFVFQRIRWEKVTLRRMKNFFQSEVKKNIFHLVLKGFWDKKSLWILTSSKF